MITIETKTFLNSSPPSVEENWIFVRSLRFRTVYMRYLGGSPRPDIMKYTPETRNKIKRFNNEDDILNYKNMLESVDSTELSNILKEIIIL
jgi:hypothetical protein